MGPLLSQVNGKSTAQNKTVAKDETDEELRSIWAPPMSSDSEAESELSQESRQDGIRPGLSSDSLSARGDLPRTKFGSNNHTVSSQIVAARKSGCKQVKPSKRTAEDDFEASGSHLCDEYGFTKEAGKKIKGRSYRQRPAYGKKPHSGKISEKASQNSRVSGARDKGRIEF